MKNDLKIRENYNSDMQAVVFTVERVDGKLIFPKSGITSFNYSTFAMATETLIKIKKYLADGGV